MQWGSGSPGVGGVELAGLIDPVEELFVDGERDALLVAEFEIDQSPPENVGSAHDVNLVPWNEQRRMLRNDSHRRECETFRAHGDLDGVVVMASPAHARRVPTLNALALVELMAEAISERAPSTPQGNEIAEQVDVEDETEDGADYDREFLEVVHGNRW
jgi:hypothetical protein